MNTASRAAAALLLSGVSAFAQNGRTPSIAKPQTVTIKEPETIELAQLFKAADIVATVRVISGDTENYKEAMYKAEVLRGFKGTTADKTLFFGPYVGVRVGGQYLLFLRSSRA